MNGSRTSRTDMANGGCPSWGVDDRRGGERVRGPTAITLPDAGETHYVSGQVTLDAAGQFNTDPRAL